MRVAYADQPFLFEERGDGLWSAVHQRLGIGAIAPTKREASDRLAAMVLERLQSMSDEEVEGHMAGCQKMGIDDDNQLVPWPDEPEAAAG